jgi:UDP-N-acetylmuramoyl-L-alanyl-D-glutamate--2,6-diaminopimelate ligase
MGSIKNKIDREEEEASLTSPSADYIQMFLSECVKQSIDYVIMEVSSHSIALSRIYGIEFSGIGFTNLSAEHMDFHETMTHYFETKTMLFNQLQQNGIIVINTDNEWGKKAIKSTATNLHKPKVFSFGANVRNSTQKNELYYTFIVEQNNINGLLLTINLKTHIRCSYLFGAFNAYNICMAYLICTHLGVSESILQSGLSTFTGVSGRLQLHTLKNGAKAFVDYAHKPGAFQAVLTTLRPLSTDLIVVFGCGGDRDKTKRPIMGKLAVDYADLVIITDDNPRNEDQHAIIRDIMAGISEEKMNKVIIELDRKKAITIAAHKSCQDSIIAILGKGHENYHLVKGKKHHFDDLEAIRFF